MDLTFNIYLIGFMGCGKSSTAEYLNKHEKLHIIDMDEEIVKRAGMPISEIFATQGEPAFRKMETDLLRDLKNVTNTVISCGGGVAMREENVALMRESGRVVLLTAAPETILGRVKNSHNRPLLEGRKNVAAIAELMDARRPHYEAAADITVETDGRTTPEVCAEILRRVSAK